MRVDRLAFRGSESEPPHRERAPWPLRTHPRGVPIAAILMQAGLFLSVAHRDAAKPNQLIWLLYGGIVMLAAGVITLGIGLLTA